jgi:hypothetical protein
VIIAIAQLVVAAVVAAATIMLAIVTWRYAVSAAETVKAMREQQVASIRPLVFFARRENKWRVLNVGPGAAVNGRYETSYRRTDTHVVKVGDRDALREGPLEPLGAGDLHDYVAPFEPGLHARFAYENLLHQKYWSRYCPTKEAWEIGEGESAPGDYGCTCKLDEKGHVLK